LILVLSISVRTFFLIGSVVTKRIKSDSQLFQRPIFGRVFSGQGAWASEKNPL
jgi:hypothetical protein